jgi:hypothetical protein
MLNYTPVVAALLLVVSTFGYSEENKSTNFPVIQNQKLAGDYCRKCYSLYSSRSVCRSPSDPKKEQGQCINGGHVGYFKCSKCKLVSDNPMYNIKSVDDGLCSKGGNHAWGRAPGPTGYDMCMKRKELGAGG